jgi:hypothetical protein
MDQKKPTPLAIVSGGQTAPDRAGLSNRMKARKRLLIAGAGLCMVGAVAWVLSSERAQSVNLPDGSVLSFHGVEYGTKTFPVHGRLAARGFRGLPARIQEVVKRSGYRPSVLFSAGYSFDRPLNGTTVAIGFTDSNPPIGNQAGQTFAHDFQFVVSSGGSEQAVLHEVSFNHYSHFDTALFVVPDSTWKEENLLLRVSRTLNGRKKALIAEFPFKNPIPKDQREQLGAAP